MKKIALLSILLISLVSCGQTNSSFLSSVYSSQSVIYSPSKHALKYRVYDFYKKHVTGCDSVDSIGDKNLLVVPIWFKDSSTFITSSRKEIVRENIEKAYFGSNEDTGWRSVKTYYEEDSYNKLSLNGEVTSWYECDLNANEATFNETAKLVKEVTSWYKQTSDITKFDNDKDGYIDAVCLIYGAPNMLSDKVKNDNLWAYTAWLSDRKLKNVDNPGPNTYFWASYDYMEQSGGDVTNCLIDTHTYIHETGHLFGLDDYYDYSKESNPIGGWTMQDMNVGGHDPYSKLALGWVEPYVIEDSTTITIKPFEKSGDVVLLSHSFSGSPFDEYLLIDYYTPTGLNEFDSTYRYQGFYPKGPSKSGVRIWHVDARLLAKENILGTYTKDNITTKVEDGKYYQMGLSNTTYTSQYSVYCSPLKSLQEFKQLQLLRRNNNTMFSETEFFSSRDLFQKGDTFSMNQYATSFKNKGIFNKMEELYFNVTIDDINQDGATITFEKF